MQRSMHAKSHDELVEVEAHHMLLTARERSSCLRDEALMREELMPPPSSRMPPFRLHIICL